MLRVTFLGTGGSIPQTNRNPSAVMMEREGDKLLFDCGEGTQRQMMKYGTGFSIDAIFISHIHGDHILGLPGLAQSWSFQERKKDIEIYCPRGTYRTIENCLRLGGHRPTFDYDIQEVEDGESIDFDGYSVDVYETSHGNVESVGYRLRENERKGKFDREKAESLGVPEGPKFAKLHEGQTVELEDGTVVEPHEVVGEPRPGRKIVYTGDTKKTERTVSMAEESQLLIHDGMFDEEMKDRARETNHSTARDAAEAAKEAGVELLALTHVSSRYSANPEPLLKDAKEVFERSIVAEDGTEIVVEYPEKDRETKVV